MSMMFVHVFTPEGFEIEKGLVDNLIRALFEKKSYVALGAMGTII
jgi:hypothetical protein